MRWAFVLAVALGCSHPQPAPAPSPAAAATTVAASDVTADADAAGREFDREDFDAAKAHAGKVLAVHPDDLRMLTIVITIACLEGDSATAQKHVQHVAPADRPPLHDKCARYGIELL